MNTDGSNKRLVYPEVAYFSWSPDGSQLLLSTPRYGMCAVQGRLGLATIRTDGSDFKWLYSSCIYGEEYPDWSPDGSRIAFDVSTGTNWGEAYDGVYVMAADGSDAVRIIAGTHEFHPRWSPDSAWLLLQSDRSGHPDLLIASSDGSQLLPIPNPTSVNRWLGDWGTVQFNPIINSALRYDGATTADFNDTATVSATLTDVVGRPIPGATVEFALDNTETCSGTTNPAGQAACLLTPHQAAGSYTITAGYIGDATHSPSSTSTGFVVSLEETTLAYTGPTNVPNGAAVTLSGVLREDGVTPIAGRTVTLTLGTADGAQSCTGLTDVSGTANCALTVNQPLGPSIVTASFPGDSRYRAVIDSKPTLVFAFLPNGSFVVGDRSALGPVTFWGAQWSAVNTLTGGSAPDSFKGFANTTTTPPACAMNWKSAPGNSAGPPTTIPSYMAVIATGSIGKSGTAIVGDTPHIVIVKTNGGYESSPGHPGTGTVLATLC